ncbi:site-specific DNA-methyltransferase [Roseococcus sp. SDR]|uniref:site-specific DNA-methyltransferase n=1 Tax=Roseococcus sp. SDR TaxID=2835532 RepID=UPI001BCC06E9|nr:site-specific DNA-methyltransferase [Roseococcus sp. SDR]MBS7790291.1 site-specific DNA-methyltransferase [Roseococcus sp. SDR]MBV1845605.1 site-specific DNA-methyltransferase [Roseococcus sp. SDR]
MPDLWQAAAVEQRPLASLLPYAANARTHSREQVQQIAGSIAQFGFVNPVLVDQQGEIIAGHGRVLAAKALGLDTAPTIVLGHLTETEVRALRLADNQIALNSGWDEQLLAAELLRIREDGGLDLAVTGFDQDEIDRLLGIAREGTVDDAPDQDDAPPPPPEPVTVRGDVWLCGDHRLLCGSATDLGDVEKALGGTRAAMAFSDPPYNVAYQGGTKDKLTIQNDDLGEDFGPFLREAMANILATTDGGCYIFMSSSEAHTLRKAWDDAGGYWSSWLIWVKSSFTLGRADYHHQMEPCLYGWRKGASHYWCGARDQSNVWHFDKPSRNDLHPTMKPIELVERAIRNSSRPHDIVLDTFGGSGTTMIAAERLGRAAALVELDARYCDVIVRRWQQMTGRSATLEGDGRTFEQLAAERLGVAA